MTAATSPPAILRAASPPLSLFDMPFSAPDRARGLATAQTPLHAPTDCKGLVLRTLPNDDHQRVFRALGFNPQVIDAKDLTEAVNSGQVDARENPLTNTFNFNLHGPMPIITLTAHLMDIALLVFNKARLATPPEDIRAAITLAASEATAAQRALAQSDDAECAKARQDAGATLVDLTTAEHAAGQAAAAPHTARAQHDAALLGLWDDAAPTSQMANSAPSAQGGEAV
ncbi:TRAP transporter substrate-binding protein DctP [Gymnodinialimonas sp. 57CJ19]|uniref:TRAP transporter substrate-binding protein DctP n=1 Tax=Gymnodinialimonas sp. 57CJ19 TaxID=3138498 RepID=UPI0031343C06